VGLTPRGFFLCGTAQQRVSVPTPRVPDREHNELADRIAEDDRGRLGALGLNNQIDGAAQYAASLLGQHTNQICSDCCDARAMSLMGQERRF
jgi:hypothetical protein